MKVYLTEEAAQISLSEEEVQTLVEGKEVIGSPDTEFLSPFGKSNRGKGNTSNRRI